MTCLFKLVYHLDKLLKLRIYIAFSVGTILLPSASVTINPNVRGGSLGSGSQPFSKLGRRRASCLVRVGFSKRPDSRSDNENLRVYAMRSQIFCVDVLNRVHH